MNPPIPEPQVEPRERERGPRPEPMKYFMGGALFYTVVGIVNSSAETTGDPAADLIIYLFVVALWLALLWRLWQGRNWARIIVMIGCALSVISVFLIANYSLLQQVVTITDAVFSAIWFWWLRTPEVVAFTKGKSV